MVFAKHTERNMTQDKTTSIICELTETELDDVVGGDAALSHELPHASHTPKQPLIVIIAVLIG
jgi:hypothetical protein